MSPFAPETPTDLQTLTKKKRKMLGSADTPRNLGDVDCSLFNHDQAHQLAHCLPICIALDDKGFRGEIISATTSQVLATEVRRIGGARIGTTIKHVKLTISHASRRIDAIVGRLVPVRKLLIYRDNLAFFGEMDLLVFAEKTPLELKRLVLTNLRIVHTRHGAGDRAIGFDVERYIRRRLPYPGRLPAVFCGATRSGSILAAALRPTCYTLPSDVCLGDARSQV